MPISVNKKLFERRIDRLNVELPESLVYVLEALLPADNILIRGGCARLVLLRMLEEQGKIKNPARIQQEMNIRDLDIVTWSPDPVKEFSVLVERYEAMRGLLKGRLVLHPEDFGLVIAKDFPDMFNRTMNDMDITASEVIIHKANGKWVITYSANAWRDVMNSTAVLNLSSEVVWRKDLVPFPSAKGMVRLAKLGASRRVEKIYLPPWQLALYHENQKFGDQTPLGIYGYLAVAKYCRNKEEQRRMLKIFGDWGLASTIDSREYLAKQELILGEQVGTFALVEQDIVQALENKIKSRLRKNGTKPQCKKHNADHRDCDLCGRMNCRIGACKDCSRVMTQPNPLPCITDMASGFLIYKPENFYTVPQ